MNQEDKEILFEEKQKDSTSVYLYGKYYINKEELVKACDEAGQFVQDIMNKLKQDDIENYHLVLSTVGLFALHMVNGISKVVAKKDMVENTATKELPPCFPIELCAMDPQMFSQLLSKQRAHLNQFYSEEIIEKINEEFWLLRIAFCKKESLKTRIEFELNNNFWSFKDSWSYSSHK